MSILLDEGLQGAEVLFPEVFVDSKSESFRPELLLTTIGEPASAVGLSLFAAPGPEVAPGPSDVAGWDVCMALIPLVLPQFLECFGPRRGVWIEIESDRFELNAPVIGQNSLS
ncbi:MAG: hypothetical protein E7K65_16775, partial [Pseudomonas sp.]|nr:hypothetical protein [Pseudomonas sp.]